MRLCYNIIGGKECQAHQKGETMNKSTKYSILAYASEPDKNYNYDGDIVDYKGKRYFVSLAEERVEFIGNLKDED